MEKSLQLYIDNSLGERVGFPSNEEQIEISAFTADYKRMGNAPTITCTVKHPNCLDNDWTYGVYTVFNNERFYLKQIPSSSFSNKDARYIHELELCSERIQLDNVFVFDVVSPNVTVDRPVSNNSNFRFFGTIEEFAQRLNYSLIYTTLQQATDDGQYISGYHVVVDNGVSTEGELVILEDKVFTDALKESFNVYNIPYYFVGTDKGTEIHLGYSSSPLTETFKYGAENSLLSIKKQNSNEKIINRITGVGSEDNLPYYYPNKTSLGDAYLAYNGKKGLASIVDQRKFEKNSLTDVFTYYDYHGTDWSKNSDTGGVVVESLKTSVPAWVGIYGNQQTDIYETMYRVDTEHRFYLDPKHVGVFSVQWERFQPIRNVLPSETPILMLYKIEKNERGFEEQKLIEQWTADSAEYGDIDDVGGYYPPYETTGGEEPYYNRSTLYTYSSHKVFNTLVNGDYALIIKQWLFERDVEMLGATPVVSGENLKLSYHEDPVHYWTKNGTAINDLSEYGIQTHTEPHGKDTITIHTDFAGMLVYQNKLMPSIYRESKGAERFYDAKNNKYPNTTEDGFITFNNEYSDGNPREHIAEFEDIKPTIKGTKNKQLQNIDSFLEFAYDKDDNDEQDEQGNYKHPYFFAKLKKLNGQPDDDSDLGFNIFHHAIANGEMTISMTSGPCSGCNWIIGVDEETKRNPVQVEQLPDGTLELKRDADGNVICGRNGQEVAFQPAQQDTISNEVWVALKKDTQTFHTVMPNATHDYKPDIDDTFVVLNINLPHSYIVAAEHRLTEELISYLKQNNDEKFSFSIEFSKIYFAENESVLQELNENSVLNVEYNNNTYTLYVTSFSYIMQENGAYPEIKVELSQDIKVTSNAIQGAVSQVQAKLSEQVANLDVVTLCNPHFLRKNAPDKTIFKQTFEDGIAIGTGNLFEINRNGFLTSSGFKTNDFYKGYTGAGIYKDGNKYIAEVDYLNVRKKATFKEVEIQRTKHIGGKIELTATSCKCEFIEKLTNDVGGVDAFKIFFRRIGGDNEIITNEWQIGDQARCDIFNVVHPMNGDVDRYYWRLVTGVGTGGETEDGISMTEYHWIVLSNKESETIVLDDKTIENTLGYDSGSSAPLVGDSIVQLGNRFGTVGRTSAIELAGAGTDSPYIKQYENITSFELEDAATQIKPGENKFKGLVSIEDGSSGIGNFSDFPEEIHNAVQVGGDNILRNTGFDGEHESLQVEQQTELSEEAPVYSEQLALWTIGSVVSVVPSAKSVSGFACKLEAAGSSIEQTVTLIKDEVYVLSFMCAGIVRVVNLSADDYGNGLEDVNCRVDVIGTGEPQVIKIASIVPNSLIWNLKLERGTIQTDWVPSQQDTDPVAESFRHLWYLQDALKGKTEILGGLILSSMLQLGNYRNGAMEQVTAGVSGITSTPETDVAFWGGGTFEQAIKAVNMFRNNPSYQPTEAELANIAKAVITHGGRAILNDIVLRGYIYALGGVFNGTVNATDGVFKGRVEATDGFFHGFVRGEMRIITPDNISDMLIRQSSGLQPLADGGSSLPFYFLDIEKTGYTMRFEGSFPQNILTITLPKIEQSSSETDRDIFRTLNNANILIYNNSTLNIQLSYSIVDDLGAGIYQATTKMSLIKPNGWCTAVPELSFANFENYGEAINWRTIVYDYWK